MWLYFSRLIQDGALEIEALNNCEKIIPETIRKNYKYNKLYLTQKRVLVD